ncbi:arylsulfatase D [Clarias gariepinus]|uniref:arylsulfatase D n=1 Tax=Clarias gariepinus TaxID=13013 RepID=UPI00234C11C2|nr:arylsulfatase D [Clarias gariepinus]XP_053353278.1 arylsulfatase D [Clarias gariepinus]XP_053353279.1 arylsulfatase D [Clarias gariepinus]XP_053353280.1 arylsulfatase D [Clarias gariepinus]XP_053353281.1 arylsulfatase D [Clarias gariepinus]
MARPCLRHFLGLFILTVQSQGVRKAEDATKPNFILMMVDDLGIGDIGCYGNDTIRTPNIDRLAEEGVKLTQHISAAPLCTPSRAAFMTGRYPLRSGLGSNGRAQVILFLGASGGLPTNATTFAKLLQKQGYTTGIVGKWHLGMSCTRRNDHCHHPNSHGFDYYYGIPFTLVNDCKPGAGADILLDVQRKLWHVFTLLALAVLTLITARITGLLDIGSRVLVFLVVVYVLGFLTWYIPFGFLRTWNCIVMRNQDVVEQPVNLDTLSDRLMKEAEQFVERNQDRPFLLFLSLAHVHVPLFTSKQFVGKSRHGLYGDNVEEVDWMIGRMVKLVEKLNLSERTLMYFTSDHGGDVWVSDSQGHIGGWNGIYRGGKNAAGWEGGIRVPGIFRWTNRLPAGKVVNEPTSLMDIFPTVVSLAGGALPNDRILDGHDLLPLLEGRTTQSKHEFMFHYCGVNLHAVRWHPPDSDSVFKVHYFTPNCSSKQTCLCHGEVNIRQDPPLVFDLTSDPSEAVPLTAETEARHGEVLRRVRDAVQEHRRTLTLPENQLSWPKVLWRPWLQPCCGVFPFCSCSET